MTEPRSAACPICSSPMFVPEVRLELELEATRSGRELFGLMLMQELQTKRMEQAVMTHMTRHTPRELVACIVKLTAELNRRGQR
jgi:hypothetical protein